MSNTTAATETNNFKEAGISFSRIPPHRTEEVLEFLAVHFHPEEPISRSLGVQRHWLIDKVYGDPVQAGACVMATDTTGKIIGVRIVEVIHRNDWRKKWKDYILAEVGWVLDKRAGWSLKVFAVLFHRLGYDVWALFDQLGCDRILGDMVVCVAKDAGMGGIGAELVKQGEAVGREEGCHAAVATPTGLYSGKIFKRAGYEVVSEVMYADFKDENGELYLNDTREHTSCLNVIKILEK